MPAYHYIALNQEQKELSGVIEAPDEQSARKKLNELHVSVVSLNVLSDEQKPIQRTDKIVFEFEALDKNGKKVSGTIVANSAFEAYVRLFDEYRLDVLSLFLSTLTPEEKENAKRVGVASFQDEYKKLYSSKLQEVSTEDAEMLEKESQRRDLLQNVDYTIERINSFLKDYGPDLKNEEREIIQSYINQLIRIKDSTNLEHIQATCTKMLDHIQKQEIFLHEEQKQTENAKVKIETAALLEQLKRTGLKQDIDIVKSATEWAKTPFLKPFANFILRLMRADNPEVQRIRAQIRNINGHIGTYLKMLIIGKSNVMRLEAWQSIKTLREEKKRLKLKIRSITDEEDRIKEAGKPQSYFWEYVGNAVGWVLAFYLVAYILSYPLTIKDFGIDSAKIPKSFYFYKSGFLKGVTIFLFLTYCSITIRNYWLRKNSIAIYALYPLTLFGFLLIVINLM